MRPARLRGHEQAERPGDAEVAHIVDCRDARGATWRGGTAEDTGGAAMLHNGGDAGAAEGILSPTFGASYAFEGRVRGGQMPKLLIGYAAASVSDPAVPTSILIS